MKCLADNVYYEARGESIKGQMLVARVTLNRAKQSHSGDICKAVYQKGQFSWTKGKNMNMTYKVDFDTYATAAKAAYAALWYHTPVYYYHATYVKPEWSYKKQVIAKVGKHIFYA